MTVRFLDPKQVEKFRKGINDDFEFKLAAKYMSKDVLLELGNSQCIVKIREGMITEMNLTPTFMDAWSFSISGTIDSWEKFLKPVPPPFYNSLFAVMIRANMKVIGDLESAFAFFWAMSRMFDLMRAIQNS